MLIDKKLINILFNYTLNNLLDDLTKVCDERFNEYKHYSDSP